MRDKKLYWMSPIIGILCQYAVFLLYAGYDIVFVGHSAPIPVSADDWVFVHFIYGLILLPLVGFSYIYLYVIDRRIGRYWMITWCAIGLILGCGIWGWHEIVDRYLVDYHQKVASFIGYLIKYLIWMAGFFIPVYWVTYLHAGRNR